ncbi:MAG: peptidylprolyl isomerase [Erythrobacter sp.]
MRTLPLITALTLLATALPVNLAAQEATKAAEAQNEIITGGLRISEDTAAAHPALTVEGLKADDLEPTFQTVDVVLATEMGNITIALETERAPVTAANFLRYIDEGRFDGTVFYRAMHIKWGEPPNGLLQGGTQNHPDRILDPIAHEPTTETGLSHANGALSMARFDPGTATGDFSIMIKGQRGLDAQPKSEDPGLRPGFAVFGYVTEGMDVVHAIHAAPIDPEQGEGWLKGQMLAEPVKIIEARRVNTAESD